MPLKRHRRATSIWQNGQSRLIAFTNLRTAMAEPAKPSGQRQEASLRSARRRQRTCVDELAPQNFSRRDPAAPDDRSAIEDQRIPTVVRREGGRRLRPVERLASTRRHWNSPTTSRPRSDRGASGCQRSRRLAGGPPLRRSGGVPLKHRFPPGFDAYWVRIVVDRDCWTTTWLTY